MRYIVQCCDGRYAALLKIPGMSPPSTYTTRTEDASEATDFKSSAAAERWIRGNHPGGVVRILNDDGSWPLD